MLKIIPFLFLFLLCSPDTEKVITSSKIISIADGDTFTVLKDNKQIRIRIDAIDAPEKGMPYGKNSKQYLSALCFGKYVTLNVKTTDKYGRLVARAILPDGRDISTEMIRAGMAWHYKKYSKDPLLSNLEIIARRKRVGLWHDKDPMAPWEVRKMHRRGISTKELFQQK
ncbi:MAG TPA: thermonuclease family protein [Flavobacterium sp.]|jgi:endonuclease YncB( thermonuclease family)